MSKETAVATVPVGIHEGVPETAYHGRLTGLPAASASILKTLFNRSPEHAAWDHPQLNPKWEPDAPTDAQINGTILHSMVLETPSMYRVLNFDAYRSNEAKAARDEVVEAGLIPILAHKLEPLTIVADALRRRLARVPNIAKALAEAQKEVTMIWEERGALTKCRFDALPPASFGFALDLKFTGRSAEPEGWGRTLVNEYLFQAALYPRAVKALRGDTPEMVFVVCETDAPYGVSLHAMDPVLSDLADRRLNQALATWKDCLAAGKWPGYSSSVHYQEPPPWELARQETREIRDTMTPGDRYARLYEAAGGPPS